MAFMICHFFISQHGNQQNYLLYWIFLETILYQCFIASVKCLNVLKIVFLVAFYNHR